MLVKKDLCFDNDLSKKSLSGIQKLAKAVKSTLGPGGNPVVIERKGMTPLITKDGVTVAKNVVLKDSFENLAVQSMIEVADRTNITAGDGTTTAIVLAEALYKEGRKSIDLGAAGTVIDLSVQLKQAAEEVLTMLEELKQDVSDTNQVKNVGTISANGDEEIGTILAEAIDEVGEDGLITLEESGGFETTLRYIEGFRVDNGYLSPNFVNEESRQQCLLKDANVFIYDGEITNMNQFAVVMQKLVELQKPFIIIAHDVKGVPLQSMILTFVKTGSNGVAIKAPGFATTRTEILKDIAVLTGATVISPSTGDDLVNTTENDFGSAKSITISRNETVIVGGGGLPELIEDRVETLSAQIDDVAEHNYDKDNLRERISRLTGGAAVIGIGATTELEMKEKKDRLEDALNATRAAIEEGILPGGGTALLRVAQRLEAKTLGHQIVKQAIQIPFKQILLNAGKPVDVVREKILSSDLESFGYDSRNNKFGDLFELGVIDPFKVVKNGLLNAVSIASLLLTTSAAITLSEDSDSPEEESFFPMG